MTHSKIQILQRDLEELGYSRLLALYSPQPPKAPRILSFRWRGDCAVGCCGSGVISTDGYDELYCRCEAGKWRRVYDGGTTDEHYMVDVDDDGR